MAEWGGGEEFFGPRHKFREKLILERIPSPDQRWCLDTACGLGTLTEKLHNRGYKVMGMDRDLGAALRTRNRGLPVLVGDATRLPVKEQSLGLIISAETLEHILAHQAAVAEFSRSLLPGGTVTISVPAHPSQWAVWDDWAGHQRRYTFPELIQVFEGFLAVDVLGYGFPFLRIYDTLIIRRLTQARHTHGDHSAGARKWLILKKLFSTILYGIFHVQWPTRRWNVGWIARFILPGAPQNQKTRR